MTNPKPPESTGLKMGDLKKLIQDTVMEAVKGVTPSSDDKKTDDTPKPGDASSIANRVRQEIETLRKEEAADTKAATLEKTVADLAAAKEQAPVERGRLHKLMGWGENAK